VRLELDHVAVGEGPGAPLPELTVVADRGLPGFVAVETVDAPVLASLIAGGRMAPTQGQVTLDGSDDAAAIRASFALVDTPSVAEPFASLTVAQVAREELALAGLRSDRASTALLLDEIGLAEHRRTRLQALPTELRVRLLCELAVLREGVRGLVLTSPERHGGDVAAWLAVVHDLVARGVTVLTITGFAALAAVEALPVPDFAAHGEHAAGEPAGDPDDETGPDDLDTTSFETPGLDTTPDDSAVAPTREDR
jgi:ABC-2 type transport system ATP-binding protein